MSDVAGICSLCGCFYERKEKAALAYPDNTGSACTTCDLRLQREVEEQKRRNKEWNKQYKEWLCRHYGIKYRIVNYE